MTRLPSRHIASISLIALLAYASPQAYAASDAPTIDETQMAQSLKQSGDLAGAAAIYRKIAARDTSSVAAQLQMAELYRKMGRDQDALAAMHEAQARQPENPDVLTQLGYTLIGTGNAEDAVAAFDRLIALEPDNASAYNGKAVAFDHAGNHLAAQELYQQALKIAPDSASIRNNLGMSLILNNQLDQAIALLEPLAGPEDNRTARQNLALAYGLKGDNDKALALNMKDLPPKEAQENVRFYQAYARNREKLTASNATPTPVHIGFMQTPERLMHIEEPEPARKAKAEIQKEEAEAAEPEKPKAEAIPAITAPEEQKPPPVKAEIPAEETVVVVETPSPVAESPESTDTAEAEPISEEATPDENGLVHLYPSAGGH